MAAYFWNCCIFLFFQTCITRPFYLHSDESILTSTGIKLLPFWTNSRLDRVEIPSGSALINLPNFQFLSKQFLSSNSYNGNFSTLFNILNNKCVFGCIIYLYKYNNIFTCIFEYYSLPIALVLGVHHLCNVPWDSFLENPAILNSFLSLFDFENLSWFRIFFNSHILWTLVSRLGIFLVC